MATRRDRILDLIRKEGEVNFAKLKSTFPNVSDMTLRRDLEMLDQEKLIVRVHGGARSISTVIGFAEDVYSKRSIENSEQKTLIANKAISLIQPDMSIFLDSGSTTTTLAHVIPDVNCLIYTSGVTCALELARLTAANVHLTGGQLNFNSLSTYGSYMVGQLECVNFNIVFLGATGYSPSTGFTTGLYDESELKRMVMKKAQKIVVLMDSSKVGKILPYTFAKPGDIDMVISDGNLAPETIKQLQEKEVIVL